MDRWSPELDPEPEPEAVVIPEITEAECRKCGTRVAGLDGRYACGVCGWTNEWTEGHRPLPRAEDDPDYPGSDAPGNRLTQ
ncbi:hypothetical protein [Streptomyces sp. NPDC048442]|uniref:hypothetical protein n=1 Tax=Streptomyces sp. NPDC048442 TaxID=3154823 RepID=UPI00341F3FA4